MSSRSSGMSNSDRSRWKLTEQTTIRVRINLVQDIQCRTWRWWHNDNKVWSKQKPGHWQHLALKKLLMTFSSRPLHRRTILKDCEKKWIVATKQHRGVHKDILTNLKIPILWETRETIPRTWSSKVTLLSNFTPRMSRLGLAQMELVPFVRD